MEAAHFGLELGIQGPDLFCASCVTLAVDFILRPSVFSSVKWDRSQIFWGSKRKCTKNARGNVWLTVDARRALCVCSEESGRDSLVVGQNQDEFRVLDLWLLQLVCCRAVSALHWLSQTHLPLSQKILISQSLWYPRIRDFCWPTRCSLALSSPGKFH